jgi:hypothetical protein
MPFTLQIGDTAPVFDLPGVDGGTHSFDAHWMPPEACDLV